MSFPVFFLVLPLLFLCLFLSGSFKNNLCMFVRTAHQLAENLMQICERHLDLARGDEQASSSTPLPQASSSTPLPQAAASGLNKRAWADVTSSEEPENFLMEEQPAAAGAGERPRGQLNVSQTYICRKILCDEPFLIAKGQFVLDEHGDWLETKGEKECIVVQVANVPRSSEDPVEGIVIARQSCQHYVGRNLYLLEANIATDQRLPVPSFAQKEGEEWKDLTTFEASEVTHFSKYFLWPHVVECTNLQTTRARIMAAMTNAGGFVLQERELTMADLENWLDERIDQKEDSGLLFSKHRPASESIAAEIRDQRGGEMVGYVKAGEQQRGHQFSRHEHRSCTVTRLH